MTLSREREEAVYARLQAMLEENLPQIRERLAATAQGKNRRLAAEAARLLKRLDDEYGPPESP